MATGPVSLLATARAVRPAVANHTMAGPSAASASSSTDLRPPSMIQAATCAPFHLQAIQDGPHMVGFGALTHY
jgi:hypothetical protein